MKVGIINKSPFETPSYQTAGSAGMDLQANITEDVLIPANQRALIKTGIYLQLPQGYEAQIRPRSGLAFKNGITVLNSPGTIDSDYRGEIGVILINHSQNSFRIYPGDRIAQMVIAKYEQVELEMVECLDESDRGEGGFGHTGVK